MVVWWFVEGDGGIVSAYLPYAVPTSEGTTLMMFTVVRCSRKFK